MRFIKESVYSTEKEKGIIDTIHKVMHSEGNILDKQTALLNTRKHNDTNDTIVDACNKALDKIYDLKYKYLNGQHSKLYTNKDFDLDEALGLREQKLTIDKVKQIAMDNYENGGSFIIETYSDSDIKQWLEKGNTEKDLYSLMNRYNDNYEDTKGYMDSVEEPTDKPDFPALGEWEWDEDMSDWYDTGRCMYQSEIEHNSEIDDDMMDYVASELDYSPSNPWDAPGMKKSDFIRGIK